jgi:hypothetical protein
VPARRLTLTDLPLRAKLHKLLHELEQTTIITTLKPHYSSLLEKVASQLPSDLDVWTAVAELLEAPDPTVGGAPSVAAAGVNISVARYLKKDWTNKFIGNSLYTLRTVIQDFEKEFQELQKLPNHKEQEAKKFYSRTLIFLQSSGVGKSRLADEFGQTCPMINYVLRETDAIGFPPADDEILSLMRMDLEKDQKDILTASPTKSPPTRDKAIWYHSLAVGVLQASFEELYKWIKECPATCRTALADLRYKEMALNSGPDQQLTYRPQKRIKFCQDVTKRAKEIAIKLVEKRTWRQVFNTPIGSATRLELIKKDEKHLTGLWNAAEELKKSLEKLQPENDYDPLLVVVFDEASSLLKEPGEKEESPGRYIALNRIMSCLREYRIWFFIISTESQVGAIVPPDNAERSGDYVKDVSMRHVLAKSDARLRRIPPFLALPLNIEDVEAMKDQDRELSKTLSDFGTQKHMALFGRRLWYAYINDPHGMNELAKQKLIGGVQDGTYDAKNVDHVFAALSFRLSLDACLHNSKAVHLVKNAVNSHMRVVLAMDQSSGVMQTVSPSEPIIAVAAMEYLCTEANWSMSISTLVTQLIEKGILEKALKGELYARLMLILAHDWIRCCREQAASPRVNSILEANSDRGLLDSDRELLDSDRELLDSDQELQETYSYRELPPDPYFLTTFTVREFLMTLYAAEHQFFEDIDGTILRARMNFTHFVPTHKNLRPEVLSDLFVDLLRRSAALQLCPGQPTYDILIPIYFGDENLPLDPSECGCMVVQVKNKDVGTSPDTLFEEKFTKVAATEDSAQSPKRQKTSKSASSNAKREKAPENASTDAKMEEALENASTDAKMEEAPENASTDAKMEEAPEDASTDAKKKKPKKPIRKGEYFVFQEMKKPILYLLFDLGFVSSKVPAIEVSYTSKEEKNIPRVWAIHSRGHDENVFGCLRLMRCEEAGKKFFSILAPGLSLHDRAAQRNDCFYELDRGFRYPQNVVEGGGSVQRKQKAKGSGSVQHKQKAEGSTQRKRKANDGTLPSRPIGN